MDNRALSPSAFLDFAGNVAAPLFAGLDYAWQAIPLIAALVDALVDAPPEGYVLFSKNVIAHRDAVISDRAEVHGPAVIGKGAEIRPGAWLRASVIVGDFAVVGNSSELKNCVLLEGALASHFNYVGDSVMGKASHLGAGTILSNQRLDKGEITVRGPGGLAIATGLGKFGAILGDRAELGCNAVCYPGSLVGRDSTVYPLTAVRGIVPPWSIVRPDGRIEPKRPGEGGRRG